MATFADLALFLTVIVFVFVIFPALLANLRWRRAKNAPIVLERFPSRWDRSAL